MKRILVGLLCIFTTFYSMAQSIEQLESDLSNQIGATYIDHAIQISDNYFEKGDYVKAQQFSTKALNKARAELLTEWVAVSLNRESKILLRLHRKKAANRAKAVKNLRQSIEMTSDKDLQIDNLYLLQKIALARGKSKEVEELDEAIARVKRGEEALASNDEKRLFGNKKREALQKVKEIQEEKSELSNQVDALAEERSKLESISANLQYLVDEKESAIEELSAEQIKNEYLLLEKERILDSLAFTSLVDSMYLANEVMKTKELRTELELQESQRNFLIALAALVLIIAFGMFSRYLSIRRHNAVLEEKNRIIGEERNRSEDLLLNILPKIVADELKAKGSAKAEHYKQASVLFTDFKNFSQISAQLTPDQLVKDLDYCFKAFDAIIGKYGLEKIKTIGDAYMCAGGLPKGSQSTAYDVVCAAIEIQKFLLDWKLEKVEKGLPFFEARVGIHTGPIVAGVVGQKKFAYDIWGDTVNVASRMESSGEPGKVNISASTYNLVKDKIDCEYRGKVPAKNFGEVDMYFVREKVA